MNKIKIITDTTSYISKEFAEENDVSVVKLNYVFGGTNYKEGFPGEFEDFFNRLEETKLFPTTSQPSAADFIKEYKKAFSDGYDSIIVIVLSSKLSGTYNSAVLGKNILGDKRISIVDSLHAVSNMRFMIEDALEMARIGCDVEEISEFLNERKKKMSIYLTVDTLEYLRRGGRLTGIQTAIGEVLNIKPIIQLLDGKLELIDKVRGKKKALNVISKKIPDDARRISICHILNEEEAIRLKTDLEERFSDIEISIDELGPVIGCHLGSRAIGICFY